MPNPAFTVVVTGLPRSGTSVMMQMLTAGGVPILTDRERQPDVDNPKGYFELTAVKRIADDASFVDGAPGKAVKIIHTLLKHLPLDREYRVIFMQRNLDEVLASQRRMLEHRGQSGAALTETQLKTIFTNQLQQTRSWLDSQTEHVRVLEIDYGSLIADPREVALAVKAFLGGSLDVEAMSTAVDPSLYRNRR